MKAQLQARYQPFEDKRSTGATIYQDVPAGSSWWMDSALGYKIEREIT